MDEEKFISDIYEAGGAPELWDHILDRLAEIASAEGSLLFAVNAGVTAWRSSRAILPTVSEWLSTDWVNRNSRAQRLIPLKEPRFLTDLDAFSLEELDKDPFYAEFLRPRGLGWCVGTAIHSPSADTIVFSIERAFAKGPVEPEIVSRLDRLRPHLARAALFSSRLGLEKARATVDALARLGLPAAVCNETGRVVATNGRFEQCAPAIVIGARDTLQFSGQKAGALFAEGLASRRIARSLPISKASGKPAFILHMMPLVGAARDVFSSASWVVFATFLSPSKAPDLELLQGLYDLTPAEARIAERITAGLDIQAISAQLDISPHTVRAHMKAVFTKTGVRRQAELVSLLATPPFAPDDDPSG